MSKISKEIHAVLENGLQVWGNVVQTEGTCDLHGLDLADGECGECERHGFTTCVDTRWVDVGDVCVIYSPNENRSGKPEVTLVQKGASVDVPMDDLQEFLDYVKFLRTWHTPCKLNVIQEYTKWNSIKR